MSIDSSQMSRAPDLDVRPYENGDEPAILELLEKALGAGPGGSRSPEFFRWKHDLNPFGRSLMLVAELEGQLVGFRAFMQWRFEIGGRTIRAVRAVDTATHPGFQRMGVFTRLTLRALDDLRGATDLVFNTPNARSGPGYLKLGWQHVGRATVSVRVRRPLRFLLAVRSVRAGIVAVSGSSIPFEAEAAGDALADANAVSSLLQRDARPESRLVTQRDVPFLRWRYGDAPLLDYRAVREVRDGQLIGLAIFRVRPRATLWQCSIADVIVERGDVRTAGRLLRRAATAAPVDFAALHARSRSTIGRAAVRAGFVPTPGGVTLVVNPLSEELRPNPAEQRSWSLSLGDLEVF